MNLNYLNLNNNNNLILIICDTISIFKFFKFKLINLNLILDQFLNLIFFIQSYNFVSHKFMLYKIQLINIFLKKTKILINYYFLNEIIWQEGLLIDFLQKKITNNWIKKFLIYSSYLFNERFIFDKIIKFFLNLIIWPLHKNFIFEINNISELFFFFTLFFFFFYFIFFFTYIYMFI